MNFSILVLEYSKKLRELKLHFRSSQSSINNLGPVSQKYNFVSDK